MGPGPGQTLADLRFSENCAKPLIQNTSFTLQINSFTLQINSFRLQINSFTLHG